MATCKPAIARRTARSCAQAKELSSRSQSQRNRCLVSLLDYLINNRPLQLHADLPPGMLLAAELKGCEEISKLYQFELGLLTPRPLAMDFSSILGKEAAVELRPCSTVTRYFHGLINRFTESRKDEHFTHYSASLVPKLWLSTQQIRNQVFQHMTVPEILTSIFTGLDTKSILTATYQPREYCVQYQESDFAFASRLMEEEGIYYFFEHRVDGHTLVLTDSHFQLTDVPQPSVIRFDELEGGVLEELRIHRWNKSQQIRTSQYTLWDYTFQMPDDHLEAQKQIQESVTSGTVSHTLKAVDQPLERYEYPGGYARHFDGVSSSGGDESANLANIFQENQRIVGVRMEEEAAGTIWIDGQSNCAQFLPGYHFNLLWHGSGDGQYLLKRVEHSAELDLSYRSDDTTSDMKYENRFICLPGELPFRAARVTTQPRIYGMQTAKVVGPTGDQVFIDKYGRIKIQFQWDRQGQSNASSSCWVRVAQAWAGNRWGAFFWPRLGQEVVVIFEEGNPDRPLIIGSTYNADNMPPFDLPTNLNLCGIRSCTLAGTGTQTFNTFVFDDTPGDEHLSLHSENHVHVSSELANYNYVPHTQIEMVGSLPFGSGSGGGPRRMGSGMGGGRSRRSKLAKSADQSQFHPTWGQQPTLGLQPDFETLMHHVLGPELVQKTAALRNRASVQSGIGGGLWDFAGAVAAGGGSHPLEEFLETQLPSSFKVVSGDSVTVNLRDNIQRYWSAAGKVNADLEDIVIGGVLGKLEVSPTVEMILGGVLGFGGVLNLACGSSAGVNYGCNLSVLRGEGMKVNQHAFWHTTVLGLTADQVASATLQSYAVRALVTVIVIGGIICDLLIRIKCVPTVSTGTADTTEWILFVYNAIYARLLGILVAVEKAFAHLQKAIDDAAAAAKDTAQATSILARADTAATATATAQTTAAEQRLNASIAQTAQAAAAATQAAATVAAQATAAASATAAADTAAVDAKATEASSHARHIAGNYSVTAAGNIEFRSATAADASSITLRAEGGDAVDPLPGVSGSLNLIGTRTVSIGCGGAGGMRVSGSPVSVTEISMDGGLAGEAKMFTGVPDIGPRIILDPVGMSLQNGVTDVGSAITMQPESLNALCGVPDVGAAIQMTPESLTIQCGVPGVGPSIKLTPESLTIGVGENTWTLSPTGLVKSVMMDTASAETTATQKALQFTGTYSAQLGLTAALATIG